MRSPRKARNRRLMVSLTDPAPDAPRRVFTRSPPPWAPWPTAAAVGALLFLYYWRVIEHRWYTSPFLFDFGWFNDLVSGRTLALDNPQAVGPFPFYTAHVSPILAGFSLLSRLLHLQGVQPLALTLSLGFAGAGAMTTVIVERFLRPTGGVLALIGGGVAGVVYGVSGLMRAIADYPHFEILYPPLALLTLHLLFQGRSRWAWAPFAACLLIREDAGLHLATILVAYLALAAIDERGPPARLRELAPILATALAYPVAAILWQRSAWPDSSTFASIYAGPQPLHHLRPGLYSGRIKALVLERPWTPLTLAASLCPLVLPWRWTLLTGAVAALPWLVLNLSAYASAAGGLTLYYGFPFLVTALAPLIVASAAATPSREERRDVVAL